ncbi:GntR family transcriptional regulator [Amycolatopsis thermoflava]|uniref:GntR family transcriptional regulator n=1 Tax=Amycolatopsis thermoflava TaxID=84480 RepID=UPI003649972F
MAELEPFDPSACPPGYLYQQLADYIARLIEAGGLPPEAPLPSERRFAQMCGVSLGTARHATELLRQRGLVVTVPSKGTFVTGSRGEAVLREDRQDSVRGDEVGQVPSQPSHGQFEQVNGGGNPSRAV